MSIARINALFVSQENAGRSLMAEACLRQLGQGRFTVFSCGMPGRTNTQPDSRAIDALIAAGMQIEGLRCKPWSAFTRNGATRMDIVIGLDAATYATHPAWPGQPATALWKTPNLLSGPLDQHKPTGVEAMAVLHALRRRIELLVSLCSRGFAVAELRHDLRDLAHLD